MNAYQEFMLQGAKDTISVMKKEEGKSNEDVIDYINDLIEMFEDQGTEFIAELAKLSKEYEVGVNWEDYGIFEQLGTTKERQVEMLAEEKDVDPTKLMNSKEIEDLLVEKLGIECEISMMQGDIDEIGNIPSKEKELASLNDKLDTVINELTKEPLSLDDLIKNATDKAKDQPTIESPTKDLER